MVTQAEFDKFTIEDCEKQKFCLNASGEVCVRVAGSLSSGSGDMLKSTYDPNSKETDAFNMDNMAQGDTKKYVSDTDITTWNAKQDALVSGTNIKTINSTSILGSGDLTVTGGLNWLEKSTTYTASNKEGILADTSGGAWTLTLPATPAIGDSVGITDSTSSFATNNLTIARNGSKIHGLTEDLVVNIKDASFLLIYTGSSTGWKLDTYLEFGTDQTFMSNPMTTAGDIIYGGTSGTPTRLAKGTDGQVLTLASGVPSWANGGGGGGDLVLLADVALSSNATTLSSGTITAKRMITIKILCTGTSAADEIQLRFNGDTGANYGDIISIDGGTVSTTNSGARFRTYMDSRYGSMIDITVSNQQSYNKICTLKMIKQGAGSGSPISTGEGGCAWYNTTSQITSIELSCLSGANILAGTRMIVYGSKD